MGAQGLPWSPNGGTAVAAMNAIGRPKEVQWWYKGGKSITKLMHNVFNSICFFTGATNDRPVYPLCDHGNGYDPPPPPPPPPPRLLWTCSKLHGNHCVHGDVERHVGHHWMIKTTSFVVALGRHKGRSPCAKRGISQWLPNHSYVSRLNDSGDNTYFVEQQLINIDDDSDKVKTSQSFRMWYSSGNFFSIV